MLRSDGQMIRLSGHTRTCTWTKGEEGGDDAEEAP